MGRILFLALVVAAGWLAWGKLQGSPPVRTYKDFAVAWAKGDLTAATGLSDERTARFALEKRGPSMLMPYPIGFVYRADHEIESEVRSGRTVEITAVQTIAYDPPGMTSVGGTATARFRHTVAVEEGEDGWRVVAFDPEFEDRYSND